KAIRVIENETEAACCGAPAVPGRAAGLVLPAAARSYWRSLRERTKFAALEQHGAGEAGAGHSALWRPRGNHGAPQRLRESANGFRASRVGGRPKLDGSGLVAAQRGPAERSIVHARAGAGAHQSFNEPASGTRPEFGAAVSVHARRAG